MKKSSSDEKQGDKVLQRAKETAPMMQVLAGCETSPPPIWLMRQAGRYLPEYRKLRAECPDFLAFCYDTDRVVEATLQPLRRYELNAAIIFSDIFILPHALGYPLRFDEGRGPILAGLSPSVIEAMKARPEAEKTQAVMRAIGLVRRALSGDVALIGFCGAPWTLAAYALAGIAGRFDGEELRFLAQKNPILVDKFVGLMAEFTIDYLIEQIDHGADIVQIFDSWAGLLDDYGMQRWSVDPIAAIIQGVRKARPFARIVVFPRGAGTHLERFAALEACDALGLDWSVSLDMARKIAEKIPVQGNLDPAHLRCGGAGLDNAINRIISKLEGFPHIFNLGHGVYRDTNPDHISQLIERVKG